MGKVRDARRTEYCKSQSKSTISAVGAGVAPARRTCEEPRERSATSCLKADEVSTAGAAMKLRLRSAKGLEGFVNANVL